MADLKSEPLSYELNNADNGDLVSKARAAELLWEHRWELHSALDALECLKIELGLHGEPTRKAAELVPVMVRQITWGSVNGRLLRRAIEAEQKLEAKRG